MRRKVGVSSLIPNKALATSYKQVGDSIALSQHQALAAQTETFKEQLQTFAAKHKKEIKKSPEFREQFQKMCREMGVDPLQCNLSYLIQLKVWLTGIYSEQRLLGIDFRNRRFLLRVSHTDYRNLDITSAAKWRAYRYTTSAQTSEVQERKRQGRNAEHIDVSSR